MKENHLDKDQEQVSLLDARAEELFQKGSYADAGKLYLKAYGLERQPNVRAYLAGQVGICSYNAGDDKQALAYLLKSSRLFQPDKPEYMPDMYGFVMFHLGSLYEYHGNLTKSLNARKICERFLDSQEKDTRWMLYAGLSRNYEALGKHDEAIKYSQKAIQTLSDNDPELAYLYESMANNYMSLQQYNEAIKHFSKILDLDPSFERQDEVYLKMADCYHRLTNYRLALQTYTRILELKQITGKRENLTWLFLKLANCHFLLEQYEQSLLLTLEAVRRKPRNRLERAEAHSFLTNNYYELGRYREAIQEGERTMKIAKRFPNDNLFYLRMALSYHKVDDKKPFAKFRSLYHRMFRSDSWNKYLDKLS